MCGIFGFIDYKNEKINEVPEEIKNISEALKKRGPDGEGLTFYDNALIGMRRLAIIDLKTGWQPLYNEDKSIAVVGNGEIYNYIELQKKLKKKHLLKTGSDIESIVHLYEDHGEKAFAFLRGMFAFAIHDRKNHKIILCRDRLGEKPLYYMQNKKGLYFSSELRPLIELLDNKKDLNAESINNFFHFGYVPEPKTIFKKIHKLKAGCYATVDLKEKKINIEKYWDIADIEINQIKNPHNDIWNVFKKSTELALRADVPIAVSLSSGIDSSAIALVAAKSGVPVTALTIGYEGHPKTDEREYAKSTAKMLGLKYIEGEIPINNVSKEFINMVYATDDPIYEIGALNIYSIYKLAHDNGFKVLLSGVGGDELFWGYEWVRSAARNSEKMQNFYDMNLVKKLRSLLLSDEMTSQIYNPLLGFINSLIGKKRLILNDLRPIFNNGYKYISNFYHQDFKHSLQVNDVKIFDFLFTDEKLNSYKVGKNLINRLSERWLTSDVIAINDRLSMANSVEVRCPLLDFNLFELVLSNKKTLTAFDKGGKYWFKKALEKHLPAEILNRPKKGFTPPAFRWMNSIIGSYFNLLYDGFLVNEKIIDKNKLAQIKMMSFIPIYYPIIVQLLTLEVWGRLNIYSEKKENLTVNT